MPMNDLSTVGLIITVATSSFASTLFGQGVGFWTTRNRDRRASAYFSLRVAVTFERFAEDCMDRLESFELHVATEGLYSAVDLSCPRLGLFPDDKDEAWRNLPSTVTAKIVDFPARVTSQEADVREGYGIDDATGIARAQASLVALGSSAWRIATDLRARFGIARPTDGAHWAKDLLRRDADRVRRLR